jgi:hypothetical protein
MSGRVPVPPESDASRATFRIISEPRPVVAGMPWPITAIKIGIAVTLMVWAIFG